MSRVLNAVGHLSHFECVGLRIFFGVWQFDPNSTLSEAFDVRMRVLPNQVALSPAVPAISLVFLMLLVAISKSKTKSKSIPLTNTLLPVRQPGINPT